MNNSNRYKVLRSCHREVAGLVHAVVDNLVHLHSVVGGMRGIRSLEFVILQVVRFSAEDVRPVFINDYHHTRNEDA